MSCQILHWALTAVGAYAVLWRLPRWIGRKVRQRPAAKSD